MNNKNTDNSDTNKTEKNFAKIEKEYSALEEKNKKIGKGIVWDTEKGIFGTAKCQALFDFFKEIKLQNYKNFLDLGSGDGRVVLIASLFTNATGIEADRELIEVSEKIMDKLKLKSEFKCEFICRDFLKLNISKFDFLFINPDKGFHKGLEEKLVKEMKNDAVLFVHNNIFLPEKLKKGKSYWCVGTPIIQYNKILK